MNHYLISPVTSDAYICMPLLLPPQSLVSIVDPTLSCLTGSRRIHVSGFYSNQKFELYINHGIDVSAICHYLGMFDIFNQNAKSGFYFLFAFGQINPSFDWFWFEFI